MVARNRHDRSRTRGEWNGLESAKRNRLPAPNDPTPDTGSPSTPWIHPDALDVIVGLVELGLLALVIAVVVLALMLMAVSCVLS